MDFKLKVNGLKTPEITVNKATKQNLTRSGIPEAAFEPSGSRYKVVGNLATRSEIEDEHGSTSSLRVAVSKSSSGRVETTSYSFSSKSTRTIPRKTARSTPYSRSCNTPVETEPTRRAHIKRRSSAVAMASSTSLAPPAVTCGDEVNTTPTIRAHITRRSCAVAMGSSTSLAHPAVTCGDEVNTTPTSFALQSRTSSTECTSTHTRPALHSRKIQSRSADLAFQPEKTSSSNTNLPEPSNQKNYITLPVPDFDQEDSYEDEDSPPLPKHWRFRFW